jgi:hypothetical protein
MKKIPRMMCLWPPRRRRQEAAHGDGAIEEKAY